MGRYRNRRWWEEFKEKPKDHSGIPDSLGLGVREERDGDGQLYIYLKPGLIPTPYIVLGKYAEPQANGDEFYVGDWTVVGVNPRTTKHVHLIMAIAEIHRIIEQNDSYALALAASRGTLAKEN